MTFFTIEPGMHAAQRETGLRVVELPVLDCAPVRRRMTGETGGPIEGFIVRRLMAETAIVEGLRREIDR